MTDTAIGQTLPDANTRASVTDKLIAREGRFTGALSIGDTISNQAAGAQLKLLRVLALTHAINLAEHDMGPLESEELRHAIGHISNYVEMIGEAAESALNCCERIADHALALERMDIHAHDREGR